MIYNIIRKPWKIIRPLGARGFFNWVPDKRYLKILYKCETGRKLNLESPKTFNEKLQWLKLYDRRSEYHIYVDKYFVRDYVKSAIGEQYLLPLIGEYSSVDEIEWESLPNQFVLKCTHGSGCNIICKDKNILDITKAKRQLNHWMRRNWYWLGREWPYKNVEPRIICEKYMVDESDTELKDYKVFCFSGEPKLIQVDYNRFTNHKRNLYDTQWNYVEASIKYPNDPTINIKKPDKLQDMLNLTRILAKNYPFVRIDFYYIQREIFFGEMTFYHGSGYEKFQPEELDELLGKWIELPMNT